MQIDDEVMANEKARNHPGILVGRHGDTGIIAGDAEMPGCVLVRWPDGEVYSVNKCWLDVIKNGCDPLGR